MRSVFGMVLVLLMAATNAADNRMSAEDALKEFQRVIVPTEEAAGFHSLEMPKLRKFSEEVPIVADTECLRFAIVTGAGDKEMCRKHADIKKITVVPLKDDWYKKSFPGDYQILVNYKGLGKLIILSVLAEDVDPFISAVKVLSPSLKVKDKR